MKKIIFFDPSCIARQPLYNNGVFHLHRAYFNSDGKGRIHLLNHDVKRALVDSKAKNGMVTITSNLGSVAVLHCENDKNLQEDYFRKCFLKYSESDEKSVNRRSRSSPDKYHFMALEIGLTLTLGFQLGKLILSPFQDIVAFDFETAPGRREFLISVLGDNEQQAAPPQMR